MELTPSGSESQNNWNTVRSHLPPWFNVDSKFPILCYKFHLDIKLSGRGSVENVPYVDTIESYCVLFKNMLVIYQQSSIMDVSDDTTPPTHPSTLVFGMVFLDTLDLHMLTEPNASAKDRHFTLTFPHGDTIKFSLPTQGELEATCETWCGKLKEYIKQSQYEADSTYIKVV